MQLRVHPVGCDPQGGRDEEEDLRAGKLLQIVEDKRMKKRATVNQRDFVCVVNLTTQPLLLNLLILVP